MIDMICKNCRRRLGYRYGQVPKCHRCGFVNDATEAETLIAELKAFELQHDAYEAVETALRKAEPATPHCVSVIRRVAYGIGADPEDLVAFTMKAKPLPPAELERVREWMKARV